MSSVVKKYFPDISDHQQLMFNEMESLYLSVNRTINLISRRDMENFQINHLLHSLSVARIFSFDHGHTIIDAGTGGGLPGIPLAVMFPDTHFILIDSIGKKIKAVREITGALGLTNTEAVNGRVEEYPGTCSHVVTRAVAPLPKLAGWCLPKILQGAATGGIIALKGGDLSAETEPFGKKVTEWDLSKLFDEPFFDTKRLIHLRP